MSSLVRLYESHAVTPELPSAILPGISQKVSQMDGPRPSAWIEPSIWYLWVEGQLGLLAYQ
jgi:hypothetical protein